MLHTSQHLDVSRETRLEKNRTCEKTGNAKSCLICSPEQQKRLKLDEMKLQAQAQELELDMQTAELKSSK